MSRVRPWWEIASTTSPVGAGSSPTSWFAKRSGEVATAGTPAQFSLIAVPRAETYAPPDPTTVTRWATESAATAASSAS